MTRAHTLRLSHKQARSPDESDSLEPEVIVRLSAFPNAPFVPSTAFRTRTCVLAPARSLTRAECFIYRVRMRARVCVCGRSRIGCGNFFFMVLTPRLVFRSWRRVVARMEYICR